MLRRAASKGAAKRASRAGQFMLLPTPSPFILSRYQSMARVCWVVGERSSLILRGVWVCVCLSGAGDPGGDAVGARRVGDAGRGGHGDRAADGGVLPLRIPLMGSLMILSLALIMFLMLASSGRHGARGGGGAPL
jgi:hypothetical protein